MHIDEEKGPRIIIAAGGNQSDSEAQFLSTHMDEVKRFLFLLCYMF